MKPRSGFGIGRWVFTILCILLSLSFYFMLINGIHDLRSSLDRKSYYSERDYQRVLLEEDYEQLFRNYLNDHYTDSEPNFTSFLPLIQYYENAILYKAYQNVDDPARLSQLEDSMEQTVQAHPEFEKDYENIKKMLDI